MEPAQQFEIKFAGSILVLVSGEQAGVNVIAFTRQGKYLKKNDVITALDDVSG